MSMKIPVAVAYCDEHEKLLYKSRSDAKRIAKEHHPRKSEYRCAHRPQYWHVGSLPPSVIRGETSRDQLFQRDIA
jgi:hypothetical protein